MKIHRISVAQRRGEDVELTPEQEQAFRDEWARNRAAAEAAAALEAKRRRLAQVRAELLDARAPGDEPPAALVAEFRALKAELDV